MIEHSDARLLRLDEEHGYLRVSHCRFPLEIGEVLSIIPNHACGATNLHDDVVILRSGVSVERWPVAARGKLL